MEFSLVLVSELEMGIQSYWVLDFVHCPEFQILENMFQKLDVSILRCWEGDDGQSPKTQ
jgi:hypothetical protein